MSFLEIHWVPFVPLRSPQKGHAGCPGFAEQPAGLAPGKPLVRRLRGMAKPPGKSGLTRGVVVPFSSSFNQGKLRNKMNGTDEVVSNRRVKVFQMPFEIGFNPYESARGSSSIEGSLLVTSEPFLALPCLLLGGGGEALAHLQVCHTTIEPGLTCSMRLPLG